MADYIEDRWLKKRPNKETGKRERTALWGKCTRYRVKGIPGVRDRSFDTVADAKAWLAEAQTDARRGDFVDARDGAISLREYVEKHWWPSQVHPARTLESMRHRIWGQVLPQLGDLALRDIGVAELRKWSADVQRAVASSTAYVAWVYLKAIMQAAVEDKRLYRFSVPIRCGRAYNPARIQEVEESPALFAGVHPAVLVFLDGPQSRGAELGRVVKECHTGKGLGHPFQGAVEGEEVFAVAPHLLDRVQHGLRVGVDPAQQGLVLFRVDRTPLLEFYDDVRGLAGGRVYACEYGVGAFAGEGEAVLDEDLDVVAPGFDGGRW